MKKSFSIITALLLLCVSCSPRQSGGSGGGAGHASSIATFRAVAVPDRITEPSERVGWLREHYWDNLDPADSLFFVRVDTLQMLNAFAQYVTLLDADDASCVSDVMRMASASKTAFSYFAMLADRVLYEPNSPLRNDEFFIPALEAQTASPLLDDIERAAAGELLQLVRQNRVGTAANDFSYVRADGRTSTLYSSKAEFVLLYFNNPGCSMCRQVATAIALSPFLTRAVEEGRLEIVAIYPDEDLEAWRSTLDDFPERWINGYDKGAAISREHLYDLKAIPSLYLLDAQRRVLVKDSVDVIYIESVLADCSAS